MRPSPAPAPAPACRDAQFRIRDCLVFKFRPAGAPAPAALSPPPVLFAAGASLSELIPLADGDAGRAVAFRVRDGTMRGLAEPGALIYFEDPRAPPTPDMLGHVVVVQTPGLEVAARRILQGSGAGLFDLESLAGPPSRDVAVAWAAHVSAIIPPPQARRILGGGLPGTRAGRRRCPADPNGA